MSLPALPPASAPLPGQPPQEYAWAYLGIVRRRWLIFIGVAAAVLAAGFVVIARMKPVYETTATVMVPHAADEEAGGGYGPFAPILASARPTGFDAQAQMLRSASLLEEAYRRAGVQGLSGPAAPTVAIEAKSETRVITIRVDGGDPHAITALANTIVRLHAQRMAQAARNGSEETLAFARGEEQKAAQRLAGTEHSIQQFQKVHPGIDLSSEQQAQTGEYAALVARVSEAQSNLAVLTAERDQLQARLAREPVMLTEQTTRPNPLVEKLQAKLDDLSLQRTELSSQFRPTSRTIQDLDRQIHTLQGQLKSAPAEIAVRTHVLNQTRTFLQSQLDGLEASVRGQQQNYSAAQAQLKVQQGSLAELGPLNTAVSRLTHERDVAQAGYDLITTQVRDLELRARARAQAPGSLDMVTSATVPAQPSRTRRLKYLALFGLMALVLATGAALLADALDDRVLPQRPNSFPLPVLGYIPQSAKGSDPLLTGMDGDERLAESYRILRANLQFAAMEAPLRTFVVTSPQAGDGKSTIALNLAVTMARAGRSVVLVDADLRQPCLARLLDVTAPLGLADALERDLPVDQVVYPTAAAGVSVLPAGTTDVNAADLLSSERMTRLIGELQSRADVVIFDTPPCLSVTDARVLAAQVDGVLLVARALDTRRAEIARALELLDQAYARTIGLVVNRAGRTERPLHPTPQRRDVGMLRAGERKELPAAPSQVSATAPLRPGHALTYLGLFLFTAILYFRPYDYIPALAAVPMALGAAIATLLAYFPSQFRLERSLTARLPEVRLVLALCALGLLSIPFAVDRSLAWESFTDPFVKAVLIFVVIVNAVRSERRLLGLLWLGLAVSCVLSVAAVNDYRLGSFEVEGYRAEGVIGGMFSNPNDMALHLVTMTPIALALMLASRRWLGKLLYGLCSLIVVAGNVVTYSRGGFLGLVAVGLVCGWRLGRRFPRTVAATAAAAVLLFLIIAPQGYGLRAASIFNFSLDPVGSAQSRRDLLFRSIQVALHNPVVGVGIGNFEILGIGEHVSHNAYTQVASEMGLAAFLAYLGFLVWPLKQLQRIEQESSAGPRDSHYYYLAIGLQASLTGYMVSSFFGSVAYQWYAYYLVGYAVCLRRLYDARPVPATRLISEDSGRPLQRRAGRAVRGRCSVPRAGMEAAQ